MVLFAVLGIRSLRREKEKAYLSKFGLAQDTFSVSAPPKPKAIAGLELVLVRAGMIIPVYRFIAYAAITSGAFFTVGLIVTGSILSSSVFGLVGLVALWLVLKHKTGARNVSFERQTENIFAVLSSSLRAGASLAQSISELARELDPPAALEFALAGREIEMGVPAAEALQHVVERVGSEDMQMLATAAIVQSRAGGNLAEILDNLADTVRDRKSLRSALKAYTAEGRLSGYVIGGIPFVIVGVVLLISPGYFDPLLASFNGRLLLGGSFAAIFVGWYFVRRITQNLDF
jgi:tight adherence protein B